jgi:magnesium transporter
MLHDTIHTLKGKKFTWVNVTSNSKKELGYLRKTYNFELDDLRDCRPELQRPKVVSRPGYLFAIFIFPALNKKTGDIEQKEVDFFITKREVITVHNNGLPEMEMLFNAMSEDPGYANSLMKNPALFISQILDELIDTCFPILQMVSTNIDRLRRSVLHNTYQRKFVYDIMHVKNNIVTLLKAAQPTFGLLKRLINMLPKKLPVSQDAEHSYDRLIDHTEEIWSHLEIYKDAIESVEDTHSTLISFRLNDILKTLTIFSVILLTLTFIANLFIMEGNFRPVIHRVFFDWWIVIGGMIFVTAFSLFIFKKKKWL